jgi:2-keto-3-deoxy-L-rhamnonate aldolase RhmA
VTGWPGAGADEDALVLCLCLTQARTVDIPMMAKAAGFDAVYIDLEHTATSLETTAMLCAASIGFGLVPLVRVPSHDHQYMTRVLDAGAHGVIVPHIDTRAEAEHVVAVCRFPPVGRRSISGTNPLTRYRPMPTSEAVAELNDATIVCVMLETPAAIANADAIASVPGIDLVLIGSHDLTAEMGILGQFRDDRFLDAVADTAKACRAHGVMLGIAGIRDDELLSELLPLGLRFISAGTDAGFFFEAASAQATRLRSLHD